MGPAPFAPRSAFTLIETLLALAVLGLIAALIVPAMGSLRWEAAAERAQAEVTAALSDARSLARARSNPVVVTLRVAADGTHELWGAVLDAANLGALPGAETDETPEAPAPTMAGRRLGVLPDRCVLGPPKPAESSASPGGALTGANADVGGTSAASGSEAPEPLQLAVVFPDGTAMVPRAAVVLTASQGPGRPEAVFRLTINPWFAEARFARIEPPKAGESEAETPSGGPDATRGATPADAKPGAAREEEPGVAP